MFLGSIFFSDLFMALVMAGRPVREQKVEQDFFITCTDTTTKLVREVVRDNSNNDRTHPPTDQLPKVVPTAPPGRSRPYGIHGK